MLADWAVDSERVNKLQKRHSLLPCSFTSDCLVRMILMLCFHLLGNAQRGRGGHHNFVMCDEWIMAESPPGKTSTSDHGRVVKCNQTFQ